MDNQKKFEIEKGIPIPKRRRPSIYPYEKMEVGDSFVFSDVYSRINQAKAGCSIRAWKKHSPLPDKDSRIYITRKVDNTVRIWRIQ